MADTPIARLSIRVFPDTTRFAPELRAKLSKIGDFKVKVNPELGRFRERIEAQLSRPFEAKVDLDRGFTPRVTQSMERAFTRAKPTIRRAVVDAAGPAVDDAVSNRLKEASRDVERSRRQVRDTERDIANLRDRMLATTREMAAVDAKDAASVRDLQQSYDRLTSAKRRAEIGLRADRTQLARAEADVRDAQRRVDAWLAANPAKVRVDVDRDSLRRVGSKIQSGITGLAGGAFRFTGSVVKIGAIGVAASTAAAGIGAMAAQAVPLAAALSQAAGVAPLIPAALAGGAAVLATMAVGAKGVLDAFKNSGDPEKYAEALAKLAPSAREFVEAGVGMKDIFTSIRMDTQQRLFQGLGRELSRWKTNLLPALRSGFKDVAGGLNDAAKSLMQTLGSPKMADAIRTLFGNTGKGLSAASGGFSGFLQGFASLSAGASGFFERLGRGFTDAGQRFSTWVDRIVANGQLDRWINNGIEAFKSIGSILGNIGSTLGSIFSAASASGGNFLKRIDDITGQMAAWAKSFDGQTALQNFFAGVSQITNALAPVGAALAGLVGTIALNAGKVAEAFAPFAAKVIDNLKPAVDVLGDILADIAPPLGGFLDALSKYIAPTLQAIGPGVKKVFEALEASGPAIGRTLESLGRIGGKVLEGIAAVLPTIASGLASMAEFVADVVDALGPVPAAIAAFLAALALSSGGGGGGGGGGWFTAGLGAAVAGGAIWDNLTNPKAESEWSTYGSNIGKAFAGGFAAGSKLPGGWLTGALGGLGAAAAAAVVTPAKMAAETFWGTWKKATGEKMKAGDRYFDPTLLAQGKNPFAQVVAGKASYGGSEEDKRKTKQYLADQQAFNKALKELYALDYEAAKKYSGAKYDTIKEKQAGLLQLEKDLAAKKSELAARGMSEEQINAQISAQQQAKANRDKKAAQVAFWDMLGVEYSKMERKKSDDSTAASGNAAKAWVDAWGAADSGAKKSADGQAKMWPQLGKAASDSAGGAKKSWVDAFDGMISYGAAAAPKAQNNFLGIGLVAKGAADSTKKSWVEALLGIDAKGAESSQKQGSIWGISAQKAGESANTARGSWVAALLGIDEKSAGTAGVQANSFWGAGQAGADSAAKAKNSWLESLFGIDQKSAGTAANQQRDQQSAAAANQSAASQSNQSWVAALLGIDAKANGTGQAMRNAASSAGQANSSAAQSSAWAWGSSASQSTNSILLFYRTFSTNAPQSAASSQANGVAAIWRSTPGYSIGSDVSAGFARGIASQARAVSNAAANVANAAAGAMKRAAQVASPSRVTMRIGEQVGEGLAIGIESQASAVRAAAQTVAKAALDPIPQSRVGIALPRERIRGREGTRAVTVNQYIDTAITRTASELADEGAEAARLAVAV
ncbi:hypothetical protein EK0264_03765 [Epidermidibacterium keratini]|uniref:Tape measure protein n=1 Tax=Epidermidibacterium keratini TaxID=1891644 RepID=A0A7L4YKA6_9ACTN|nr:hypothetical protein [Epidermidibacterium keratini]QHB99487.1 hypothetical protein EK0264_03765 [Epidermidibacterium keratini]